MTDISDIDRDKAAEMQSQILKWRHTAETLEADGDSEAASRYQFKADGLFQECMELLRRLGITAGKDLRKQASEFLYPVLREQAVADNGRGLVKAAADAKVSLQVFTNNANRLRHTEITDYELVKGGNLRTVGTMVRVTPLKGRAAKPISIVQPVTVKVDEPTPEAAPATA